MKAADHHEQAAKTHRAAAQEHGSNDHSGAKQQSAQARKIEGGSGAFDEGP
jgi:hypothetical protein